MTMSRVPGTRVLLRAGNLWLVLGLGLNTQLLDGTDDALTGGVVGGESFEAADKAVDLVVVVPVAVVLGAVGHG